MTLLFFDMMHCRPIPTTHKITSIIIITVILVTMATTIGEFDCVLIVGKDDEGSVVVAAVNVDDKMVEPN